MMDGLLDQTSTVGIQSPRNEVQLSSSTDSPVVKYTLPTVTTGTSETYISKTSEIYSRAFAKDAVSQCFGYERLKIDSPPTTSWLAEFSSLRVRGKVADGAIVAEAANWAAIAVWEPPGLNADENSVSVMAEAKIQRPMWWDYMQKVRAARIEAMGEERTAKGEFWHLCMMGRDPERKDKGAVRAVVEAMITKARQGGHPCWLEAGSERARDVYGWLGFEVVHEIRLGEGKVNAAGRLEPGGSGVTMWLMVCR